MQRKNKRTTQTAVKKSGDKDELRKLRNCQSAKKSYRKKKNYFKWLKNACDKKEQKQIQLNRDNYGLRQLMEHFEKMISNIVCHGHHSKSSFLGKYATNSIESTLLKHEGSNPGLKQTDKDDDIFVDPILGVGIHPDSTAYGMPRQAHHDLLYGSSIPQSPVPNTGHQLEATDASQATAGHDTDVSYSNAFPDFIDLLGDSPVPCSDSFDSGTLGVSSTETRTVHVQPSDAAAYLRPGTSTSQPSFLADATSGLFHTNVPYCSKFDDTYVPAEFPQNPTLVENPFTGLTNFASTSLTNSSHSSQTHPKATTNDAPTTTFVPYQESNRLPNYDYASTLYPYQETTRLSHVTYVAPTTTISPYREVDHTSGVQRVESNHSNQPGYTFYPQTQPTLPVSASTETGLPAQSFDGRQVGDQKDLLVTSMSNWAGHNSTPPPAFTKYLAPSTDLSTYSSSTLDARSSLAPATVSKPGQHVADPMLPIATRDKLSTQSPTQAGKGLGWSATGSAASDTAGFITNTAASFLLCEEGDTKAQLLDRKSLKDTPCSDFTLSTQEWTDLMEFFPLVKQGNCGDSLSEAKTGSAGTGADWVGEKPDAYVDYSKYNIKPKKGIGVTERWAQR